MKLHLWSSEKQKQSFEKFNSSVSFQKSHTPGWQQLAFPIHDFTDRYMIKESHLSFLGQLSVMSYHDILSHFELVYLLHDGLIYHKVKASHSPKTPGGHV